jgi:hypothetical protein
MKLAPDDNALKLFFSFLGLELKKAEALATGKIYQDTGLTVPRLIIRLWPESKI